MNENVKCPFCAGTKITPFTGRIGKGQECDECDNKGNISLKKIYEYGIESFINIPEKMKRNRGNNGYIPSPEEIRSLRGDRTQSYMSSLIYTTDRIWRSYELGEARMHPAMWELICLKLKGENS
ncbi:MAG TPA: hypothetical protein VFM18_23590 [Methanosarcina sp.]|nr:hypothetical protein [Methanosarcina sp.]